MKDNDPEATVVATVNGRQIIPITSQWGMYYLVKGLDSGYRTLKAAKQAALVPYPQVEEE